jgi:hypothetical protein
MKIDAMALANQVRSILMLIVGFVLAILLAGTVARAAKLGVPWLPSLDPQTMGWLGIAWWTTK